MAEKEKLVLLDGHSIINRAFYGMPDLTSAKGVHTGAVYGFLNIMFRILDEEEPDYLLVAFDTHAPTFRHAMYSAYKRTRKAMPEELRSQVPLLQEVLGAMGIAMFSRAGLEADDILGSYAVRAREKGIEVSLVSGDRDLLQVADESIMVRIPKTLRGQTTILNYHAKEVEEQYSITPAQVIELKGLMGDSSDNIPGVPGVGEKTAQQLLASYGTVAGVYEHLEEITKKGLHDKLEAGREKAELSRELARIRTDCDVPSDFEALRKKDFYTKEAFALFSELGFRNFLGRFDDAATAPEEDGRPELIRIGEYYAAEDVFAVVRNFMQKGTGEEPAVVGIYPLFDREAGLYGTALSIGFRLYYFDAAEISAGQEYLTRKLGVLRRLAAELPGAMLALFDIKSLYPYLDIQPQEFDEGGIRLAGCFDGLLGCYLCNPLKNDYTVEDCAGEYLGATPMAWVQLFGKKSAAEIMSEGDEEREKLIRYAASAAEHLRQAAPKIRRRLAKENMLRLYEEIELPLSFILYDMQRLGIRILPEALRQYSAELGEQAERLEKKIYEATGETFNIASPKQLGEILFEKMGIPGGKRTRTGWSTAADILTKLAPDYPVIQDILDYRAVTKLKSTYADGLAAFVGEDLRIHTSFNQTITATGRISSNDPNLQNIPMRTEMGRLIRRAFVPRDGYIFTDSDYSQIELRILASMSGDRGLIEAYRQNRDIHAITASKVFHVPFEEVTPLQRRNAKAVNFGIVYGISSFGLSQDLSISREEAQRYIASYFETYPGIREYLDRAVAEARADGFSKTLYGRRRPVPELSSSNFMTRQFGERVAMNAPIQGTAADIMKIAMIRVWERIHREKLASSLILQIHDELLVETASGEEEQVRRILAEEMQGAAELPVALETDIHTGRDWYEAK
ncbi:DNA polymerase I [Lachnoclostridium sp. Marseille-P6806]|uniref:DNA polymerase I n=1 Tax=Lachnoclostridium sp. Marseille-P6806 TaxID=2364793 RepID=UPI001031B4EC|nr:DNA polymerase I [Lachnoclostridium sp. Marseille-P6806]